MAARVRPSPALRHVYSRGRKVAIWDWPACEQGVEGPATVVLVHATGFHARCWDEVVRGLPPSFRCLCPDMLGHGLSDVPREDPSWRDVAQSLLDALAALGVRPDDVAVLAGHSAGGLAAVVAAANSPTPFPALLLIDPVIQPPENYGQHALAWMRDVVLKMVLRRKDEFASHDDMHDRYRARAPYSTWNPQVLRDYCDHALSHDTGSGGPLGVAAASGSTAKRFRLRCRPVVEAAWYLAGVKPDADVSREVSALAARRQRAVVLRAPKLDGGRPFESSPTDPELARRLGPGASDVVLQGVDHFIPMARPEVVAGHVLALAGRRSRL